MSPSRNHSWDGCLFRVDKHATGERGVAHIDNNFNRLVGESFWHLHLDFTAGEARSLAAALVRGAGNVQGLVAPVQTD